MKRVVLAVAIWFACLPGVALAGFGADVQQITYTGTLQVGQTINLNVKVKNLSTVDSGYGGDATFCIACNIDPPGLWNDFDQEKPGQSFGLNQTKTISMPSFQLDDNGTWKVKCEARDSGCNTVFDSLSGTLPVEDYVPDCPSLGYPLGPCGGASADGDCNDQYTQVLECVDAGPLNCWEKKDSCSGQEVCHDPTFSAAECIAPGHEDYCTAMKDAGGVCTWGEADCDFNNQCAGGLDCKGPVWPYSGNDGCCFPDEDWNGQECMVVNCATLGYPLGECGSAASDGDCKDDFDEVWECVDAGPMNCWELKQDCAGLELCFDAALSAAKCVGPGSEDYCAALKEAGDACGYGESDCDFNSQCADGLDCVGPVWPFSGMDGCCLPGEEWDGSKCLVQDCGVLGYPLGECDFPSSAGACSSDFGIVRECVDAGPINCWSLKDDCSGGVCYVSSWDGAASCVYEGDDAYCTAMKKAGSGCGHGQSDCDFDSECLGALECLGSIVPFTGVDGCCNPDEEWDGEQCTAGDCSGLGYPLGDCGIAASDGECSGDFAQVWQCVDAGPVNCWAVKEECGAPSLCFDGWLSGAGCVEPGHDDYCKAKKAAGTGCSHGQSDCDGDSECTGALTCLGPVWPASGLDGCCLEGEEWDGVQCIGDGPDDPLCPPGCLASGEMVDEFDYEFEELISDSGLWEKQSHDWVCPLDPDLVFAQNGVALFTVPAGAPACAQVDSTGNDYFYGSYRASIRTSPISGLCAAFFFYGPDGESEIDVEILSKEKDVHRVHLVTHPSGDGECGTDAHKCVDMAVDPSDDFHVYGWDLYPDKVLFFIDEVQVEQILVNIPENPGTIILSNWSGNSWTGPAPEQDSAMLVEWVEYVPFGQCEICGQCGNDMVGIDEECDGPFVNGATCESLGMGAGELWCGDNCLLDASGCGGGELCGDGQCQQDLENCENCAQDCGPCEACGDGLCDNGETCQTCADDCGECCGNGKCEPALDEDCESCAGDCGTCPLKCGNDQCDAGEGCDNCPIDCGECCGNGKCEPGFGEVCDLCPEDCGECQEKCGDGSCDPGEHCANCAKDCGDCCGDGICQGAFGEGCQTCQQDCGQCPASCGDGECGETEGCLVCPGDCGTCCGDGTCQPHWGEDCVFCPFDCGECPVDCGNGLCDQGESCINCPEDCQACCGDGKCQPSFGEDCVKCAADCGACDATCKDGVCQATESCQACPSDCGACCGNQVCEADFGEDCMYCPEDCGTCGCQPECAGKQCGDNGCGGFCGSGCGAGQDCVDGLCVTPSVDSGAGDVQTQPEVSPWFVAEEDGSADKSGGCSAAPGTGAGLWLVLALLLMLAAVRRAGSRTTGVFAGLLVVAFSVSTMAADPITQTKLTPTHDTYATHNDQTVHGQEPILIVGIEPQECFNSGWNPCPDDDKECCETGETYNYCAPPGECENTTPTWGSHRKFRGYVRFDLSTVPEGKVVSANLRFQEMDKVEDMGGPVNMVVTQLKKIGIPNETCEWDESTLNDTNGTTWNSLPQNLSLTEDGVWNFDVTKAVENWLTGNVDVLGTPVADNCGFYLYDPDFGNAEAPIIRWVAFSSKEGGFPPQLSITMSHDVDGDGWFGDCNEEDPEIHPEAVELCDGVDQDCDGVTDEEGCDGVDNDCDGEIDEGDDLCPDGTACLYNSCIPTCVDECAGPSDKTCKQNEAGIWEEWACKNTDGDPCLEYYLWETCKEDYLCNLGHCSSNCLDLCEADAQPFCYKDHLGRWFLAECDDYDGDGCLEAGALLPCGGGAHCANGACLPDCQEKCEILADGGCLDACVPEEARCVKQDDGLFHLEQCKMGDLGCLYWSDVGACDNPLKPWCHPSKDEDPAPDAYCSEKADCDTPLWCTEDYVGLSLCVQDSVGAWSVTVCGDEDGDGCLTWEGQTQCEPGGGCVDAQCTPGCDARCDEPFALECAEQSVMACHDINGDGCLEWENKDLCDESSAPCQGGYCIPVPPDCDNECAKDDKKCMFGPEGAQILVCVTDQDDDVCWEWSQDTVCPWGCAEDGKSCAQEPVAEPQPEPVPDHTPDIHVQPDVAPEVVHEVIAEVGPTTDVAPDVSSVDIPVPDQTTSPDVVEAGGGTDGGCGCTTAPSPAFPAGALLLLLAGAALLAAVRRRRA